MKIYRLENSRSEGPYCTNKATPSLHDALSKVNSYDESHPNPYDEGMKRFQQSATYVCGFSSRAQFEAWFPYESHDLFDRAGFSVSEYEVPDEHVEHGRYQVMFDRAEANFIQTIRIGA